GGEGPKRRGRLAEMRGEGRAGGQRQQPGLSSNPRARAALAGIAAMAIKRVRGARAATASADPQTTADVTGTMPGGIPSPVPGGIPTPPTSQEARTTATAGAATERWHEVVAGDTLSKLAARYYGDGRQYMKIFEANRDTLTDPDRIRIGQRLRIP